MINKGHGLLSVPSASLTGDMNSFTLSLAKKCERLATAEYLVTSFLSDSEPLKARLRSLALDLMRDASLARSGTIAGEGSALENLRANINDTLSLSELAFIGGLVSEMNFSILKREYVSLRDAIDIKKASRDSRTDSILDNNFFGASEPVPRTQRSGLSSPAFVSAPASHPSLRGGTTKQSSVFPPAPLSDRNPKGHSHVSSSLRGGTTKQSSTQAPFAPSPLSTLNYQLTASIARDSRRTRIIKLIKDKREVAVKDIMEHFPDLSEKTIQRELVSLTDSNVLKKSGERRWSRYVLA